MAIEVVNHTLMYNYPLNPRILYFVRFNYAHIDVEVLVIYFLDPLWEGDKGIVFSPTLDINSAKNASENYF